MNEKDFKKKLTVLTKKLNKLKKANTNFRGNPEDIRTSLEKLQDCLDDIGKTITPLLSHIEATIRRDKYSNDY